MDVTDGERDKRRISPQHNEDFHQHESERDREDHPTPE